MRYEGEIKDALITGFHLARVTQTTEAALHRTPLPLPRRPHEAPREAAERKSLRHMVCNNDEGKARAPVSQAGAAREDGWTRYCRRPFQKMLMSTD